MYNAVWCIIYSFILVSSQRDNPSIAYGDKLTCVFIKEGVGSELLPLISLLLKRSPKHSGNDDLAVGLVRGWQIRQNRYLCDCTVTRWKTNTQGRERTSWVLYTFMKRQKKTYLQLFSVRSLKTPSTTVLSLHAVFVVSADGAFFSLSSNRIYRVIRSMNNSSSIIRLCL